MARLNVCIGAIAISSAAIADIVTNDVMSDVTVSTVLSGVTNIISTTRDVNISADLTLTDRSFVWLQGAGGVGYVNIAPTAADATLTIDGNSGFFTAYRYSGDGWHASSEWGMAGIDQLNSDIPNCYYRMRMGVEGGEPGTTGRAKIVVKTNPSFGYRAFGGVWARYLYVEPSVSPDPDTGTVDFLEIAKDAVADISHIEVAGNLHPARILFHGGTLLRDNATYVDAPLAPREGATLILKGVGDAAIGLKKMFLEADFTARLGGVVRIEGKDLLLTSVGYNPESVINDWNFRPWNIGEEDRVEWRITGDIRLCMNTWLKMGGDNLFPIGPSTGGVILQYDPSLAGKPVVNAIKYCCLDLNGTTQCVNSVTSTGSGDAIGVVTNTAWQTKSSTLCLGKGGVDGTLNAKCTANVAISKQGECVLYVRDTTGESLDIQAGEVRFSGASSFTNVTAASGASLRGEVAISGMLAFSADVDTQLLKPALSADASMKVSGVAMQTVSTLSVGGKAVNPGVYKASDAAWLAEGTVLVLSAEGFVPSDVEWVAGGSSESASDSANWSAAADFTKAVNRPVFAKSGTKAVLDGGMWNFAGLSFDAAGGFTVSAAGADSEIRLFGNIDVAVPDDDAAHPYVIEVPTVVSSDLTITIASNVTVAMTGGLSGIGSLTMTGVNGSGMMYGYNDREGGLVLENPRISGKIEHKLGGGWLTLRGDVGCPGDGNAIYFDYSRYVNGHNGDNGVFNGSLTVADGVTFHKPVEISGVGQIGGISDSWFRFEAGSTNVFRELVKSPVSVSFRAGNNAQVVFEKGCYVEWGSLFLNGSAFDEASAPCYIFNGPVRLDAPDRHLSSFRAVKFEFRCAGSYSRLFFAVAKSRCTFGADEAFTDTGVLFSDPDGRFGLGTTRQTFKWMSSGAVKDFTADGGRQWGTISGTAATLAISPGVPDEGMLSVTNCGTQITGWVKLVKSGDGFHRLLARDYESYGDVEVSGGTLVFDPGATWLNGTNVIVNGTGTLKTGAKGTFGRDCVLSADGDGWTIDLTGNQRVSSFWVDGVKMPSGTYGSSASSATDKTLSTHFAGTGVITVPNKAMRIVVR